jgi:hypothetical protein
MKMNGLKTIGRKIAPYVLAGAVALGGYGCEKVELPINQETRETIIAEQHNEYSSKQKQAQAKLDEMIGDYWSKLNSAETKFNEYIAQRNTLTITEQEDIFKNYESAIYLKNAIINYAESEDLRNGSKLLFPKEHSKLYVLLNNNLNDAEFGITGLEEELRKNGINISVEKKITAIDNIQAYGFLFLSMFGLAGALGARIAGTFKLKNYLQGRRRK